MALTFVAFGAWSVLPYSMIEIGMRCWAFRWIERHANDWARVPVRGDQVVVERIDGGAWAQREFNKFRTRLESTPTQATAWRVCCCGIATNRRCSTRNCPRISAP
jgi:uncharacterized membrane protein